MTVIKWEKNGIYLQVQTAGLHEGHNMSGPPQSPFFTRCMDGCSTQSVQFCRFIVENVVVV